jgi:hypothetical protein
VWLLCVLVSTGSYAEAIDHQVEASLTVEGKAMLNPDGTVASYTLREPEKLPQPVVDLVKQSVPVWKFRFADGTTPAAPVEESMVLLVVATDVDATHTTIRIAGAQFSATAESANEHVVSNVHKSPMFPQRSLQARMSGTVYVLVRVGRDGTVLDAAAEQVNLHRYAEQDMLKVYRRDLADAAVTAIKRWTFTVPTAGPSAQQPYWYVRVPCNFHIAQGGYDEHNGRNYGTWAIYVRGPREIIPWLQDKKLLAESPDATPDGTVHQLGTGVEMVTPLTSS